MPSHTAISVSQLSRLVGLPNAPIILDVRSDAEFEADRRLLPAATRRTVNADLAQELASAAERPVVVVCINGRTVSEGEAAWLRQEGVFAETLEGGFEAWGREGGLLVNADRIPDPNEAGRTVWVTRARPKVDRIACPWLIRRFVDPRAAFLFVAATEVTAVAQRYGATPFDVDGVFWSHRGDHCSFDTMMEEFGLDSEALQRLATIVRAADTNRLDLVPQAAGFLAASLGLSRMYRDDLAQLDAGMLLYDAFYRWCRDAVGETHNWPADRATAKESV